MTVTTQLVRSESIHFDFVALRKGLLWFAFGVLVLAPFSRDPLVVAACGVVPWVLVGIVDKPNMPSVVIYYLIFMWLQAAARVLLASLDGEALDEGFYGADVNRAFWYSMASLIVFATMFRITLQGMPAASEEYFHEHFAWKPMSLFYLYLATLVMSFILAPLALMSIAIAQPVQAVGSVKYVAMFMLFASVLSTGRGLKLLLLAFVIEVISGFTGLFSGFKTVFIVLLLAALTIRIPLRLTTIVGGIVASAILIGLGLFWTAVKSEYRDIASGYTGDQVATASALERAAVLVGKAVHPEEIDWGLAADQLLRRIAYIDFFGASITITETAPDLEVFARWRDALEHVAKPRILFPGKAALNDSEVFIRYVRPDTDEIHSGTSISIGFLAENFIDFGFPGMVIPVAALGLLLGAMMRYFMTRPVAWVTRESCTVALILALAAGMEVSLAKFLGSAILIFIALALSLKFIYPSITRWLRQ